MHARRSSGAAAAVGAGAPAVRALRPVHSPAASSSPSPSDLARQDAHADSGSDLADDAAEAEDDAADEGGDLSEDDDAVVDDADVVDASGHVVGDAAEMLDDEPVTVPVARGKHGAAASSSVSRAAAYSTSAASVSANSSGSGELLSSASQEHLGSGGAGGKTKIFLCPSLYGRPATVYFDYPLAFGMRRNQEKILCDKPCTLRFKHADAACIYNSITGTLKRAGFVEQLATTGRERLAWNLRWGKHMMPEAFKELKSYQKINHFPGTGGIGRKDRLARNIAKSRRLWGGAEITFLPETYLLPADRSLWELRFAGDPAGTLWISKPNSSSCGRGIKLVSRISDIPPKRSCIVSRYISNPLLVRGHKFDLRIYVLVTSFNPLRIYLYQNGLARFCTSAYDLSRKNLHKKYMHLTNFSVNKRSANFVANQDASGGLEQAQQSQQGQEDEGGGSSKWSLRAFRKWLLTTQGSERSATVWANVTDIFIKTLLSVETNVSSNMVRLGCHSAQGYELYGFDILLDANLKPWLMEVNCVAAGTAVQRDDGSSAPIEEIAAGAGVLALSDSPSGPPTLRTRSVSASQGAFSSGVRPCVELLFDDGRTLVCTPEHLVLTDKGQWIQAGQLVIGRDAVAVSVEGPMRSAVTDAQQNPAWRLDVRAELGFELNMQSHRAHSLAFARILGYAMTNGSVQQEGARVRTRCFLGHPLDVEMLVADVRTITGQEPSGNKTNETFRVTLPDALSRALSKHGLQPGARVGVLSHMPAWLLSAECPVTLVREFLGGLFGGDGHTLHKCMRDKARPGLDGLGFAMVKNGSVARKQMELVHSELYVLLQRTGIATAAMSTTLHSVDPTCVSAAGHAALAAAKSNKQQLSHSMGESAELHAGTSYTIDIAIHADQFLPFTRYIGFRYCVHKQVRLSAAAGYYRATTLIVQQRQEIARVAQDMMQSDGLSWPPALKAARARVSLTQTLHPEAAGWQPDRCDRDGVLEVYRPLRAGVGIEAVLERWDIGKFFSTHNGDIYAAAAAAAEPGDSLHDEDQNEDAPMHACYLAVQIARRDDLTLQEEQQRMITERMELSLGLALHHDQVSREANALPTWRMPLVGRRAVGDRTVFDLHVPHPRGQSHASFTAAGIVVHNCAPSLSSSSPLDKRIKNELLTDTMHTIGIKPAFIKDKAAEARAAAAEEEAKKARRKAQKLEKSKEQAAAAGSSSQQHRAQSAEVTRGGTMGPSNSRSSRNAVPGSASSSFSAAAASSSAAAVSSDGGGGGGGGRIAKLKSTRPDVYFNALSKADLSICREYRDELRRAESGSFRAIFPLGVRDEVKVAANPDAYAPALPGASLDLYGPLFEFEKYDSVLLMKFVKHFSSESQEKICRGERVEPWEVLHLDPISGTTAAAGGRERTAPASPSSANSSSNASFPRRSTGPTSPKPVRPPSGSGGSHAASAALGHPTLLAAVAGYVPPPAAASASASAPMDYPAAARGDSAPMAGRRLTSSTFLAEQHPPDRNAAAVPPTAASVSDSEDDSSTARLGSLHLLDASDASASPLSSSPEDSEVDEWGRPRRRYFFAQGVDLQPYLPNAPQYHEGWSPSKDDARSGGATAAASSNLSHTAAGLAAALAAARATQAKSNQQQPPHQQPQGSRASAASRRTTAAAAAAAASTDPYAPSNAAASSAPNAPGYPRARAASSHSSSGARMSTGMLGLGQPAAWSAAAASAAPPPPPPVPGLHPQSPVHFSRPASGSRTQTAQPLRAHPQSRYADDAPIHPAAPAPLTAPRHVMEFQGVPLQAASMRGGSASRAAAAAPPSMRFGSAAAAASARPSAVGGLFGSSASQFYSSAAVPTSSMLGADGHFYSAAGGPQPRRASMNARGGAGGGGRFAGDW